MFSFHCGDDADFGVGDPPQHGFGVIVAGSEGNHKFIHQRQDDEWTLGERITEFLVVAEKGEPADFHGRMLAVNLQSPNSFLSFSRAAASREFVSDLGFHSRRANL